METKSVAKRAIALLSTRGAMRTAQIAEALGVAKAAIASSLGPYVHNGTLIACKVESPGTPPENEWRISAGGKAPNFNVSIAKPKRAAAPAVPAAQPAVTEAPAKVTRAYKRRAPLRTAQENTATSAKRPRAAPGTARSELLAVHHAVMNPQGAVERGGDTLTVKMVKEFIGADLAAHAPPHFRTAIASDGAMLFLGAAAGPFELSRAEARLAIEFVRTLDRGEVGA